MNKYLKIAIGPSNSGKSTWAKEFNEHLEDCYIKRFIVLNADLMRKCVTGDINNQDQNHQVFQILEKMCAYFMEQGENLIVDNTNVSPKQRKIWIQLGRQHAYKIKAYCFKTPLDVCLARNAVRERSIPSEVICRQFNNLVWPDFAEFDEIEEINNS
jgi:protein phosphatase